METREEQFLYDIECLSKRNKVLSEEISSYKKINSELQKKILEQERILENYSCRIDELESQIQFVYKEQIEDFADLIDHLKNAIRFKKLPVSDSDYWEHKYKVLSSSKLGRFTLKYWEYRDRLKLKIKGERK